MEWAIAGLTTGAFVDVFTVPAGKKYEVLSISCAQYSGVATVWRPSMNFSSGAFYAYLDEFGVPAAVVANIRSYSALLIPAGVGFAVGQVAASAVAGIAIVTYMNVDL